MRSRGAFWGTVGQAAEQTPEGSKQTRLLTVPRVVLRSGCLRDPVS